ncbi:uncharacterized protein LOC101861094 [Aplysia californica]|uniref:Uncharacterized protein LOC101861094 n=1 Tax=Aplysia californica TaxID=6500 RepID=A0ABM0JC81_APLCA|nr:uncharacterized protein LOC101861094 [Aplysia californica]
MSTSLLHLSLVMFWASVVICEQVDMSHQFTSLVEIQKVKERIMRGLNRSIPPSQPKTTRMLNTDTKGMSSRRDPQTKPTYRISKIWSEAKDAHRASALNFNMESLLHHNTSNFTGISLIVTLRTDRSNKRKAVKPVATPMNSLKTRNGTEKKRRTNGEKSSDSFGRNKKVPKKRSIHSDIFKRSIMSSSEKTTAVEIPRDEPLSRSLFKRAAGRAGRDRRRRRRKNRKNRRKSKQRRHKVKIVVRHYDPTTSKKKRVAMHRVSFTKRTVVSIPLPLKLLQSDAFSENKTLTLFISCKRCRQSVHLEHVYRRRKQTRKKGRSLNPNRPYLVIQSKVRSLHRSARHVDSSAGQNFLADSNSSSRTKPRGVLKGLFKSIGYHALKNQHHKEP